jgi:uncharacterized protein (TIGR00290 family)
VKVLLSWSSGKDSAWALHVLRAAGEVEVVGLLTTLDEAHDRVAMHAVRRRLLEAQAGAAGLPLVTVPLPWPCSNAEYEARLATALDRARREGVSAIAFGDLFLEDVRAYRERLLGGTGLAPLFPLWGRDTRALAREMVEAGLQAWLTCVDARVLPRTFAGRAFDDEFLQDLPPGVDPCGERGEFHSFACAGPMFAEPVAVQVGQSFERDGFVFTDLLPAETEAR